MNDSPPMWWYEPPELHEIDLCFDCHDEGYHEDNRVSWIKAGCDFCYEDFREKGD